MTRDEIAFLLAKLGIDGRQIVVHSSLAGIGDVEGGADAVCAALMDAVGEAGAIIMPAFTADQTLPAEGGRAIASFHPELSVDAAVGAIAESFRRLPTVLRSNHPTHSFCAWGHHGRGVLSTQRDNNVLGPLKKLNVAQGDVLLLGVSLRAATALHLAEEQLGVAYLRRRTAVRINAAGYDERVVLENVPGCSVAFDRLEARLDPAKVRQVELPAGHARRIPIRYLVTLAATALREDPAAFVCDRPHCADCEERRAALRLATLDDRTGRSSSP